MISLSSLTEESSNQTLPSRQVRILPGLGKVHIVHTYDRIVPYIGHKKLTVVTLPPKVHSTSQSILRKEYDWIENKIRPWVGYSATNRYLNSDSSVRFVYVRNPITGLSYHSEYNPSRYYNFYRINRSLPSYDDYWPYYRPLSLYNSYWPFYRSLSYIDDVPVSRSLKLQRTPASLAGLTLSSPYYPTWYHYYTHYRYRWPLSSSYDYDYPYYYYYNYYPKYTSPLSVKYWPYWSFYYYPRRSYYWQKYLPLSYNLNTNSSNFAKYLDYIFDDETRLIRAQSASLLKAIHLPVPRIRSWSVSPLNRSGDVYSLPVKYGNDTYIHRLLTVSPNSKVEYSTYYTEPVRKYIGHGHLSCVSYAGDKGYSRRRPLTFYEDAVKNDIQLLSYYINKFRDEKKQPKEIQAPLPPARPSRIFTVHKPLEDSVSQELKDLKDARAARLAKIYDDDKSSRDVETSLKSKKKAEEARLAEEKALADEQERKVAQAKKEEAAKQAELARQEKLAAQAAAERAAEQARQEELARQVELQRQKEEEELEEELRRIEREEQEALRLKQEQEERKRLEEEELELKRLEEEERELLRLEAEQKRIEEEAARAEEERQALIRLEEIARQAEEEREADLARQAEELAELARQEELERQAKEQEELKRQEEELAELERQEAELAELERQERELAAATEEEETKPEEDESKPEEEEEPVVADDESDVAIAAENEQPQELTDEDVEEDE